MCICGNVNPPYTRFARVYRFCVHSLVYIALSSMRSFVIDNGGCTVRMSGVKDVRLRTNAVCRGKKDRKIYIGDKILNCAEYILARPISRGLVTDWELQKLIWESMRSSKLQDSTVVLTIGGPFAPNICKRDAYDVLFEDCGFSKALVVEAPFCAQFSPGITSQFTLKDWQNPCGLLIEAGFSHCVVVPVYNTQPIPNASVKLPVGARILNNLLRDRLAYMQYDLDDNPLLVQHIRETMCRTAKTPADFANSITAAPGVYCAYELPSGGGSLGFPTTQPSSNPHVILGADTFAVPEAVFNPLSVGLDFIGLGECVKLAISKCPEICRKAVCSKIILFGGLAKSEGFQARLAHEIAQHTETADIRFLTEPDGQSDLSVWRGANNFTEEDLNSLGAITKQDWADLNFHI